MSATSNGQLLDLSPRRKSAPTSNHEHGQVVAKFSDFHAFAVSGYLGDSTHNYCFVQVREGPHFHCFVEQTSPVKHKKKIRLMLPESLTVHDVLWPMPNCMYAKQTKV